MKQQMKLFKNVGSKGGDSEAGKMKEVSVVPKLRNDYSIASSLNRYNSPETTLLSQDVGLVSLCPGELGIIPTPTNTIESQQKTFC